MAQYKKGIHEGVKYIGDLTEHKRAAHEGVTYSCRQCDYQTTPKGSFAKRKTSVHE